MMGRATETKGRRGGPAGTLARLALSIAAIALPLFPCAATSSDPADRAPEYAVKAAFLYNFAKFVTWPAEPSSSGHTPFCIGIVGDDPVGDALSELVQAKTLGGRTIHVERFAGPRSVGPCQILFVPVDTPISTKETMRMISAPGVLTVGESEDFARLGGAIRLFMEQKKMRFEINLAAAEKAGLQISSKMLALARLVESPSQGEENP